MNKFDKLYYTLMEEVSTFLDSENKLPKPENKEENSDNAEDSAPESQETSETEQPAADEELKECAGIDCGNVMRSRFSRNIYCFHRFYTCSNMYAWKNRCWN